MRNSKKIAIFVVLLKKFNYEKTFLIHCCVSVHSHR